MYLRVAMGWRGPEQRRAPRIDVLRRVSGTLIPIDSPVIVHDLSRTGFEFVRGELLGLTQESRIDRLIEAMSVREGMLVARA